MEDIKIVEPEQEIVEIPKVDIYYMPFTRFSESHDWCAVSMNMPTTIDGAKSLFKGWDGYEKMILKISLPASYEKDYDTLFKEEHKREKTHGSMYPSTENPEVMYDSKLGKWLKVF